MAILDELFQIDGVTAVGTIDDVGRIMDWKAKGVVSHEVKEATSKFMASVVSMFNQEARLAPRNWSPRRSWTFTGGDMVLIVVATQFVAAETAKVDLEKLFKICGIFAKPES